MPDFRCDLSQSGTPFTHVWEHTVGSDHAPVALRADWQEQLTRCHEDLGFRHVRFHGLLSDDMGTLIDHEGRLLYSFFNADQITDFLLSIDMKPFVELSFMPKALASGARTVFNYEANVTPPRDYEQWGTLVRELVGHWRDRYGLPEIRDWFFEVWNEPNLNHFWTGTREEYFKLYRYAVEAIKEVDPSLRVGGPATAKNEWIDEFLEFCEGNDLAADFVTTHHYPTDAYGEEGDDTTTQLALGYRSMLREQAQDVRRRARGRPVYYTEWNTSSNPRDPLHDEPYAAAFVVKTVMEASNLVDGYSFWTFTDIFEENYFPSVPFHGGFGLLTLHGTPKPTYRAFELLHRLGDEQLLVDGLHPTVDAWIVREAGALTILLANHALPRHPIAEEAVHIGLQNAPAGGRAWVQRIDETRGNPKRAWEEMGQPRYLSAEQVAALSEASRVPTERCPTRYEDHTLIVDLPIRPHGVVAVTLDFA